MSDASHSSLGRATGALTSSSIVELGASAASVRALLREGTSENTTASYRAALRYWTHWHTLRLGCPLRLPVPPLTVLQFVVDHLEHRSDTGLKHDLPVEVDQALVAARVKRALGPFKLNTVQHRLAVLSELHLLNNLPSPCRAADVRMLLSRVRRAYARRGGAVHQQDALTREPLERLLATCDDSLIGKRDRALLLFAWASGGRRRSEVVRATLENTVRVADGFVYELAYSKTNQEGKATVERFKPILGRAAAALEDWIRSASLAQGALFRRVRRGGVLGAVLSSEAIRRMVRARATQAGLAGDYGAHSLRAGFVTEAASQGIPLAEIMALTGHTSVNSVIGYHRLGTVSQSRAGRLLDAPGKAMLGETD